MFQKREEEPQESSFGKRASKAASSAGGRISNFAVGKSDDLGWIVATVLAFALGLLGGILIAPRSGRETRRNIGDKAKDVSSVVTRRGLTSAPEVTDDVDEVS